MISKAEYYEAKSKAASLTLKIVEFELKDPLYRMWKLWESFDAKKRQDLVDQWESYYLACRQGAYGQAYDKARLALKEGRIAEVQQTADEVRNMSRTYLKEPSSVDPRDLERKLAHYFMMKQTYKEFQSACDEYGPVYEPKSSLRDTL